MTATDLVMPVLGGEKILVVESDDDAASTLTAVLRLNGFNAQAVATGKAALQMTPRFKPRVLVLDLDLPDADPCDIIRQVRAGAEPPVVIVLTAHTDVDHRRSAMAAGAHHYLLKPNEPIQLVRFLNRLCSPATAAKQ